jgi:hypothetical protein
MKLSEVHPRAKKKRGILGFECSVCGAIKRTDDRGVKNY